MAVSLLRPSVLGAGGQGPLPYFPQARGCGRGGLSQTPQCTLLRGGFVRLFGRHKGTRGGGPHASVRGVQGCSHSLPQWSLLGAGGPGPLPFLPGRAGCGRGDPSPNPPCTFLRAGFARCGGGTSAPGGGMAPRASMWGVQGWALSLPQLPVLGAGSWGPLPVCRGRGECGHGDPSPTPQRTLLRAGGACCGVVPW